eukprot:167383_1
MSGAYTTTHTNSDNKDDIADEINENINETQLQQYETSKNTIVSNDFQIALSFKSVVQLPKEYGDGDDEDLSMHIGHYYNDSNYTLPTSTLAKTTHAHIPQTSYTFNMPKSNNNSSTFGPSSIQSNKPDNGKTNALEAGDNDPFFSNDFSNDFFW